MAFSLSTKDRVHLTREILPPFLGEGRYDLFWLDGSATEEGRRLPFEVKDKIETLREIHTEVYGGPDVAIVRALTRMIECGYAYCGLIENDVKLQTGWFANLMSLLEKGKSEGLNVGAVGSRTYHSRVLIPRGDFAVMFNLGAGMILLSQPAAKVVLNGYRTASMYEVSMSAAYCTGAPLKGKSGPLTCSTLVKSLTTADWWFDSMLQLHGFSSLAPAPTMARNIDPVAQARMGDDYVESRLEPKADDQERFEMLKQRQGALVAAPEDRFVAERKIFFTNPEIGNWIVFPHQALALNGCSLAGEWKLKWKQNWGPFTFVTQSLASRLRVNCVGDWCGLCVLCGPKSGLLEARAGDLVIAQVDLRLEKEEMIIIQLQLPHFDNWQIEIRPCSVSESETRDAIIQWAGLIFKDVQPWFSAKTGFQFSVLEKYV